jgi:Skp family chaperone for outer membrane proteins
MRFTLLLLLLLVFCFSGSANADTYQWTDSQGVVNFSDNPENVPKKYRSKVKVTPSVDSTPNAPNQEKTGKIGESGNKSEATTANPGLPAGPNLYGGHDERWWKSRYAAIRSELKNIQDNLPAKRDELDILRRKLRLYTYTRNRIAYQDKLAEIQRDEDRIKALTDQLASLDTEAATAGVPFDWRQ